MIDPNETDDDKRKRELLLIFRRGYSAGAGSLAHDKRFAEHERGDIVQAYLSGYQKGHDAATLAAAEEADRIGYDARLSILRGAK